MVCVVWLCSGDFHAICHMARLPEMTRHVVQRICGLRCRHERVYAEVVFSCVEFFHSATRAPKFSHVVQAPCFFPV
jgi:hypothetical protein